MLFLAVYVSSLWRNDVVGQAPPFIVRGRTRNTVRVISE